MKFKWDKKSITVQVSGKKAKISFSREMFVGGQEVCVSLSTFERLLGISLEQKAERKVKQIIKMMDKENARIDRDAKLERNLNSKIKNLIKEENK